MKGNVKLNTAVIFALAAAMLLVSSCSCEGGGTDTPKVSAAPQVAYTSTRLVKYWPEEADYSTCDYYCTVELPEFSMTYTAGYSMNKAVAKYLEDLESRILGDYLKNASVDKPHTEVTLAVEYIPGITDVIFTEVHSYLDKPVTRTHVLMLDDLGREVNLCDVFLDYHLEDTVAALIAGRADVSTITALTATDIYHGAKATLAGCTVYARGVLSPAGGSERVFDFTFDELSPASRFSAVDRREYESLSRLLWYVSDAAVVRQENIADGVLSPFEASSFMGEYCLSLGILPEAGRIRVPEKDFEEAYRRIFGAGFPGVDADGHDIKKEDGFYLVLNSNKPYEYHVDVIDVSESGDRLTVTGDLVFGAYGYASSEYVCHVTAVLEKSADSPFGFRLVSFTMSV